MTKGKLIVIDGTDGSGKKTQTKLLIDKLNHEGHRAVSASFPQYGKKSAGPTEEFLSGKYGRTEDINSYAASLFYAIDRFDLSHELKKLIQEGYLVVLDRYVDSNAGHQGGKIKDPEKRKKFIEWLYDLEYSLLGIPRPDLVVILHVPVNISIGLIPHKQTLIQIEKNHVLEFDHLKNAESAYLWLAEQFPQDHRLVECIEEERLLSPEEIHEKIWQVVKPILNTPAALKSRRPDEESGVGIPTKASEENELVRELL
jgi:dTMP kinase